MDATGATNQVKLRSTNTKADARESAYLNLVRRIQKRHWLGLHGVRDRNPDTDGWWVINALLSEVRRGSLLAIKGPRADLFPRPHGTPLRTLPAGSVQYDPATWQARLRAARAAIPGGSSDGGLSDADVAMANDMDARTPLGNTQPFEYSENDFPDATGTEELAGTTNEKYARKMLGYDSSSFREMIHRFKKSNGIGPNDDLEFEENGDVYFNGDYLDNFHGYDN
ncbi:hypothetical protein [Paraburkholderia susongensis]|uniref:Uncharacterized protein n=1 Tax=Paraburkholderia susongensis TaxID=1515439 RepID=A0A1X7KUA7_9BURK|nr:hypothetical protein [Paraburkholderia susongensis]SMG45145.1 hypothetical protein SAMN06265784_104344 [Paraburkholderia susongensis]